MMHSLPLTLAAWNDYIGLMLVGAMVIGSWIANMKKKGEAQRKRDEGPASMELEEMAARRREQLRQASRGRTQISQGGGQSAGYPGGYSGGGVEPGNLTMAERIARARAKAQYEQRAQASAQPAQRPQPQVPNEAQRRALAQRQAEIQRRQQAAQAQQRAQQQSQQRARLQAQHQRAQAQAHARAQAQARQRGTLMHDHVEGPPPTESTTRRLVPSKTATKRPPLQPVTRPVSSKLLTGSLSRDDLRRAIVLNEVLGKPVALRDDAGFSY